MSTTTLPLADDLRAHKVETTAKAEAAFVSMVRLIGSDIEANRDHNEVSIILNLALASGIDAGRESFPKRSFCRALTLP